MRSVSTAELKRILFRIYNSVNKEIYGYGVTELKISIVDNILLFMTKDNRVHTLEVLEEKYSSLKQSVDQALFTEFKIRLKDSILQDLDMMAVSLHRDYDSGSRIAITVVVFDEDALRLLISG